MLTKHSDSRSFLNERCWRVTVLALSAVREGRGRMDIRANFTNFTDNASHVFTKVVLVTPSLQFSCYQFVLFNLCSPIDQFLLLLWLCSSDATFSCTGEITEVHSIIFSTSRWTWVGHCCAGAITVPLSSQCSDCCCLLDPSVLEFSVLCNPGCFLVEYLYIHRSLSFHYLFLNTHGKFKENRFFS